MWALGIWGTHNILTGRFYHVTQETQVLILIVIVALLAACGDDDKKSSSKTEPTPTVAPENTKALVLGDISDNPEKVIKRTQPIADYLAAGAG